jgi:hypothetical protein
MVLSEQQAKRRVLELVWRIKAELNLQNPPHYIGINDPIAKHLGVEVKEEYLPFDEGEYMPKDPPLTNSPIIVLDPRVGDADRLNFTFFHEIMHHLIREDDELYSFLHEYTPRNQDFKTALERYCNIGAAEFLIPAEDVRKAIAERGFSIRLVEYFEPKYPASKPAIAIQLAQCATHKCFVVVCEWGRMPQQQTSQVSFSSAVETPQLYVLYASSSSSTGYPIGRFVLVPSDHVIAIAYETQGSVKDIAPILFRSGNRRWKCECEAFYYKGKVYAAFNASSPTSPNQPRLL